MKLKFLTLPLAAAVLGLLVWRMTLKPPASVDYGRVADFTLVDQNGRPFGLKDLKGKIWIADFFFTQCMGPCPILTEEMAKLQREFAASPDVRFVSFSVDPDHDTPAELATYAAAHGADTKRWTFLTGPKEKIFKIVRDNFHLAVDSRPGETPSMNDILHSVYFVLADKQGKIIGYYNTSDVNAATELKAKIKAL